MSDDFLGGVIEGFYGRPWTHTQRLTLIRQLPSWGLNTYFYAPKDDLKHRALWRQPYDEVEIAAMRALVSACGAQGVHFIYGLSPGLDIEFSSDEELQQVKSRLVQMIEIGAVRFALLFDDLPGQMTPRDRGRFGSVAAAQCHVTNQVSQWLTTQVTDARLLFCPTPYCDRMDRANLAGGDYLDELGELLDPAIEVFWTGPEIISADIPVTSIERLSERIKRPPVIWDNLHANDYDQRRLYCGPYNRGPELRRHVRGILSNPNNEFPINEIPLRTLGAYLNHDDYEPRRAYLNAAENWSANYTTIDGRVSVDDLVLLGDCHYLPHADGPVANELAEVVQRLLGACEAKERADLQKFNAYHERVVSIFEQLTQLRDRELFYAWSRRIWDLREELDLIGDFVSAAQRGEVNADGFASPSHLPGTYRGGFVARLQRMLAIENDDALGKIFNIRDKRLVTRNVTNPVQEERSR